MSINKDSSNPLRNVPGMIARERSFLIILAIGFVVSAATYRTPHIAMWIGFAFAGYSAIANDSIQTIGTFIAANRRQAWWKLWLFMGGIFLLTAAYSFVTFDGDVSYQRLAAKGFETSPTSFSYLQIAAPLILMILTRLRMPVSTTFLLLSSFATDAGSVGKVLGKSLSGYVLAFGIAIVVWMAAAKVVARWTNSKEAGHGWRVAQWVSSGILWSVWLQQDAANIAVYLPRSLSIGEFAVFAGAIFLGLGLLFRMGGEKVQQVVDEKSDVVDVRAATLINVIYAGILYYFKFKSNMPMSTTWVFIGLLGGREIAMAIRGASDRSWKLAARMVGKDFGFATIGLIVSIILAAIVNEPFRNAVFSLFS